MPQILHKGMKTLILYRNAHATLRGGRGGGGGAQGQFAPGPDLKRGP